MGGNVWGPECGREEMRLCSIMVADMSQCCVLAPAQSAAIAELPGQRNISQVWAPV
jgi:hypothetical protein